MRFALVRFRVRWEGAKLVLRCVNARYILYACIAEIAGVEGVVRALSLEPRGGFAAGVISRVARQRLRRTCDNVRLRVVLRIGRRQCKKKVPRFLRNAPLFALGAPPFPPPSLSPPPSISSSSSCGFSNLSLWQAHLKTFRAVVVLCFLPREYAGGGPGYDDCVSAQHGGGAPHKPSPGGVDAHRATTNDSTPRAHTRDHSPLSSSAGRCR